MHAKYKNKICTTSTDRSGDQITRIREQANSNDIMTASSSMRCVARSFAHFNISNTMKRSEEGREKERACARAPLPLASVTFRSMFGCSSCVRPFHESHKLGDRYYLKTICRERNMHDSRCSRIRTIRPYGEMQVDLWFAVVLVERTQNANENEIQKRSYSLRCVCFS